MLQQQLTALEPGFIAESATGCRHGAFPFGGLLVNFLPDFLPCVPPLGLGRLAVTGVPRRAPAPGVPSRLPAASLISRSLISSHWASVRWRSGIARSCCRRSWGEIGCGAFMLPLSHRSTRAACARPANARSRPQHRPRVSAIGVPTLRTMCRRISSGPPRLMQHRISLRAERSITPSRPPSSAHRGAGLP